MNLPSSCVIYSEKKKFNKCNFFVILASSLTTTSLYIQQPYTITIYIIQQLYTLYNSVIQQLHKLNKKVYCILGKTIAKTCIINYLKMKDIQNQENLAKLKNNRTSKALQVHSRRLPRRHLGLFRQIHLDAAIPGPIQK